MRRSAMKPASAPAPAPAPAQDVVELLRRLTSFMALRDPELLAAAAAAVGADTLIPLFQEVATTKGHKDHELPVPNSQPRRQQQGPHAQHNLELHDESKLQLKEAELAKLHHEAESTKQRIVEVHRQAKAADAAAAKHAQEAAEAAPCGRRLDKPISGRKRPRRLR